MSKETFDDDKVEETPIVSAAVEPFDEGDAGSPVGIVVPSGALNTTTWSNEPWFYPYLPQTFAGTVSGGVAQPTLSGSGYLGSNNTGFVFQNGQYNSRREGSGQ
jgi:hypothetical protein